MTPRVHCPNCGEFLFLNGDIVVKCPCGVLFKVIEGNKNFETYVATKDEVENLKKNKTGVYDFTGQYLP